MVYIRAVVLPGLVPYLVALTFAIPAVMIVGHTTRIMGVLALTLMGMVYTGLLMVIIDQVVFESGERLWFHALIRQYVGRFLPHGGMVRS